MSYTDTLKAQSAKEAIKHVKSSMVIGLGTGSTVRFALEFLGEMITDRKIKDVVGIPSSKITEKISKRVGIPLGSLEDYPEIDLTIDGADEVDPDMNLIKGGGGALLREKIIAQASKRNIIIVDESKLSPCLGTKFYLPVEVIPFGYAMEKRFIKSLGAEVKIRQETEGYPFLTDQGNYILECNFGPIRDLETLSTILDGRAGIMAHGLFVRLATEVIIAQGTGIRYLKK